MPKNAGGRPDGDPYALNPILDSYYEMGDLGFLTDESDSEGAPPVGSHFYDLPGPEGVLLDGLAALYGGSGLHPTTSRAATLTSELSGLAYEWDLDDVGGERWSARQDPWDGP
ncbi:MAG TPA: hypothetical protein VK191_08515 [Symbiobacteriaceae bacterium]|nr:hypothetical protein [Symbiobacteriaceae bacterium]